MAESDEASIPLDLLGAGDPRFVEALRAVSDSDTLARFASTWMLDARPESRLLLFAYLDQPPDAPGHEGLIKRLFKLAEAANDDAAMARFLVLCDRLIRRKRRVRYHFERKTFATIEEAQAQEADWIAQGWIQVERAEVAVSPSVRADRYLVVGHRPQPIISTRGTTLPRADHADLDRESLPPGNRSKLRYFSVATRRYLQRRVWRYFRTLARTEPARYVAAASSALKLYRDSDLTDGSSLLDHFGLIHLLFGRSPALRLRSSGWDLTPGRTLAELAPAPSFEAAWLDHPEAVLRVLAEAGSAVVARWALRRIEANRERFLEVGSAAGWVDLLDRDDPDVVALAVVMLDDLGADRLRGAIPPDRWASVAERAAPENRGAVCEWIGRAVRPEDVPLADAVRLATRRPESPARLGWGWVQGQGGATVRGDGDGDPTILLRLLDAECPIPRPSILRGVRESLAGRVGGRSGWVWAMLDSRHADARAEGWAWFMSEPSFQDDPELWAKLVESPYRDIQAACSTFRGPIPVDPGRLGVVWASVLLASDGLARIKPGVIRRVVARLEAIPDGQDTEVEALLSLLTAVARSVRSPERRGALAALVGLIERRPEWSERIIEAVPALQFDERPAILPP